MSTPGSPYGWLDFEPEPDMTGDGEGDPDKHILLIGEWANMSYSHEVCVIVHRTCGGTYPIDGALAEQKRLVAQHIVKALNDNPIDWDDINNKIDYKNLESNAPDTTILPEVRQSEGPRTVTRPNKTWRYLTPGARSAGPTTFSTQAERDQAAQAKADELGLRVIVEFWDWMNPQDEMNQGWACDGVIEPTYAQG